MNSLTFYCSFGALMPGRNASSGDYRYGFNGKENDDEVKGVTGSQQDYGMRIYDPRLGKFLSVDPITAKYPMLTPYQFASNTPIQAIDLDGLEAFFVGGTWQGEIETWSATSQAEIADIFGNSTTKSVYWSGHNNKIARKIDAHEVAKEIYNTYVSGGCAEPITLVGHSHGGNVLIEAANILKEEYGVTVDNLLTVNTPNVNAHQLDNEIKNDVKHFQIYNEDDIIQPSGGSLYTIEDNNDKTTNTGSKIMDTYYTGEDMMTGEMGPAKTTFKGATNI